MDTVFKLKKSARSSLSSSSPPDWASLPEELLELILHRINQLSDYLRFAAVCKPWLLAANHQKDHRRREIHKQVVPMLLIHSLDQKTKAKEAGDNRFMSIIPIDVLKGLILVFGVVFCFSCGNLLDLSGIIKGAKDGKGRGRQVISTARSCNCILIVLDAIKPITHKHLVEKELGGFGIRFSRS